VINRDNLLYFVSLSNGSILAKLEVPACSGGAAGIRFLPDGRHFSVLWRDGRIDLFNPGAMRDELTKLGLNW
jgi:hypothetical protein